MRELPASGLISPDLPPVPILPVRWGVVGAGDFARGFILPAMRSIRHIEITAVHRRQGAAAADTAEAFGAKRACTRVEALLKEKNLEAVFVATPTAQHEADVIAAAAAGKRWILCAPPLAVSAAAAQRMLAACAQHDAHLFVAHSLRHRDAVEKLRRLIAAGELGDIRALHAHANAPAERAVSGTAGGETAAGRAA
ncbi:MAG: Gfo/Idh/MocA family protein, partial [Planctomycetota bacterium]